MAKKNETAQGDGASRELNIPKSARERLALEVSRPFVNGFRVTERSFPHTSFRPDGHQSIRLLSKAESDQIFPFRVVGLTFCYR